MAKGRKRKPGRRTKSGQLSRAGCPKRVQPNDHAVLMIALYGDNWPDPIGRAFESGLLGEGTEAKALLDTARAIHSAYWQAYAVGPVRSAQGDNTGGGGSFNPERIRAREEWLSSALNRVRLMGVRRQFDELVIDINPDAGPAWLDRLIYAKRTNQEPDLADKQRLRAALDGLEIIGR